MKIDLVRTIVAICIGALLGWGFYAMAQDSMNGQPLGFAIGIETALLGIGLVGIEYEEYPRSGTMIRATCALGTLVLLVLNAIYAYTGVNTSFYIFAPLIRCGIVDIEYDWFGRFYHLSFQVSFPVFRFGFHTPTGDKLLFIRSLLCIAETQ